MLLFPCNYKHFSNSLLDTTLSVTQPLTFVLVEALIVRLHCCVEYNNDYCDLPFPFPYCESNGKLYVELCKLLYALNALEVLKQHQNVQQQLEDGLEVHPITTLYALLNASIITGILVPPAFCRTAGSHGEEGADRGRCSF